MEDARHLSPSAQEALRLRAVAALVSGWEREDVAAVFRVSLKAVDKWWAKWRAGGRQRTVVTLDSQLTHGIGSGHAGQTTQNGKGRVLVSGGQFTLIDCVRGVDPHRSSGQLTLVRHQDPLVVLNVEDLRDEKRQRVPRNVRVHLTGQAEISWRPATPHFGGPAFAQPVDDALGTSTDTVDIRVSTVGEVRKPRVVE